MFEFVIFFSSQSLVHCSTVYSLMMHSLECSVYSVQCTVYSVQLNSGHCNWLNNVPQCTALGWDVMVFVMTAVIKTVLSDVIIAHHSCYTVVINTLLNSTKHSTNGTALLPHYILILYTPLHRTVYRSVLYLSTVLYYCTVLYCTVLYCTVLYCTVLLHCTTLSRRMCSISITTGPGARGSNYHSVVHCWGDYS